MTLSTTPQSDVPVLDWFGCYAGSWASLITPESFAHPAKFAPRLIDRIIRHGLERGYWKRGDVIGDPFGGIGGGGIMAASAGMGWIGVELEARFVAMGQANFALHRDLWTKFRDPLPVLIQGDSRRFAELIRAPVMGVVTSPPYADTAVEKSSAGVDMRANWETYRASGGGSSYEAYCATQAKHSGGYGNSTGNIATLKSGDVDGVITSPPFGERTDGGQMAHTGETTSRPLGRSSLARDLQTHGQIELLRKNSIDHVITSPPYAGLGEGGPDTRPDRLEGSGQSVKINRDSYGQTDGQIGRASVGQVDSVITSPPYSEGLGHGGGRPIHQPGAPDRPDTNSNGVKAGYGKTGGQIGDMASGSVDAVVTSPPWEDQESSMNAKKFRDPEKFATAMSRLDGAGARHATTPSSRLAQFQRQTEPTYGTSDGQVGNITGETYWQAMHQVYAQCLLALRPGSTMAVVVKDYVKHKQRVPLCDDTLRLLVHIGFEPVERIRAWLTARHAQQTTSGGEYRKSRKSFFRRLAEAKGSPRIDWEEVIVVRRPAE